MQGEAGPGALEGLPALTARALCRLAALHGRSICSDPKDGWVKKAVKHLQNTTKSCDLAAQPA